MNFVRINTAKKAFIAASILLITMLLVNKALFTHMHILRDGTLITHSHPFSQNEGNKNQQHKHSDTELKFLMSFGVLAFLLISAYFIKLIHHKQIKFPRNLQLKTVDIYFHRNGRAPPTNSM